MYEHADQSWKDQPKLMSFETRQKLAFRIGEYARSAAIAEVLLVFHGGEPLLAGPNRIIETLELIREAVPSSTRVDACVQTNGVLLDEHAIDVLAAKNVGISVSIDGPQLANDLHRLDHVGSSTFKKTLDAVQLLQNYPDVYTGLIAVIDPRVPPEELFPFFKSLAPPRLDFLLPDSNHQSPPPGRSSDSEVYVRWLLSAFDLWFDSYSDLPVRTFDAILNGVAGMPSETDAFGFGDVSMLTIETDGGYHDLDVLKITAQGGTETGLNIWSSTVIEAATSEKIQAHRRLLRREGMSDKCNSCSIVDICGGGAVPHRYDGDGFQNPTVYCQEMLALVGNAKKRIRQALSNASDESAVSAMHIDVSADDLTVFDDAKSGRKFIDHLWLSWANRATPLFLKAINQSVLWQPDLADKAATFETSSSDLLALIATQPSVFLWTTVINHAAAGVKSKSIDGQSIDPQPNYVSEIESWIKNGLPASPRLHRPDPWLRLPFGSSIIFEASDCVDAPTQIAKDALKIIKEWDASTYSEICRLSPEIQFIQDPTAHPDKAVSFSDNTVPGALYVSVRRSSKWINAYDLADSIIHEHRHQKLYLLQANSPILSVDAPLVHSPWREDLRPPSGLFHAVFVFTALFRYWQFISENGSPVIRDYAVEEMRSVSNKLKTAFPILSTTSLTKVGRQLVEVLKQRFESTLERAM